MEQRHMNFLFTRGKELKFVLILTPHSPHNASLILLNLNVMNELSRRKCSFLVEFYISSSFKDSVKNVF